MAGGEALKLFSNKPYPQGQLSLNKRESSNKKNFYNLCSALISREPTNLKCAPRNSRAGTVARCNSKAKDASRWQKWSGGNSMIVVKYLEYDWSERNVDGWHHIRSRLMDIQLAACVLFFSPYSLLIVCNLHCRTWSFWRTCSRIEGPSSFRLGLAFLSTRITLSANKLNYTCFNSILKL